MNPIVRCATCGAGCYSTKETPECGECRSRRTAGDFWSPDVLNEGIDGRWVVVGGVKRWEAFTRPRRAVAVCGTDSGYYRHLRRTKTKPCDPCKRAHAHAENRRAQRARGDAA